MYALHQAKQEALTALKKAIGKGADVGIDDLASPPDPAMGDLAFPCFILAKKRKGNPAEIASELAAKIGPTELIAKAEAEGPYVNFRFNDVAFTEAVLGEVAQMDKDYGRGTSGDGVKVSIEYAQPNTHKLFHVGHVRNAVLGQSIVNVLAASGYDVVPVSYIGDSGVDVSKAVWGFKTYYGDEKIAKENRIATLQDAYVRATAELEERPELKEELLQVQVAIESGEEPWFSLWKETREWSLDAFKDIFAQLHVTPEAWYFESELDAPGKEIVNKLLTDGIAKKSDGATIVDLEDEGHGVCLILKSDGTTLYSTWDLALAYRKAKEHKPDRQIIVVDVRQSLHFRQVFAILKRMGFKTSMQHVSYDFVTLPEGAMSSRKGLVVTYEDLRGQMEEYVRAETMARHEDWDEKKVAATVKAIVTASMTFMMLRQDPKSVITFDMKEAMSFEGFTGPYILYTIARIERVQEKAPSKGKMNVDLLGHPLEQQLIRQLAEYPDVVARAAASYNVASIATWAFETAKLFSEYYHQVRIIADGKDQTASRVGLSQAVAHVLTLAMSLLGIDVLKEM